MSLRQEILNEIKNMLNEATAQELSTTTANIQIGKLTQYFEKLTYDKILQVNPAIATDLLEDYYVLFSKKYAESPGGITVGNALQIWQRMNGDKKKAICKLGNESNKYSTPINLPSGGTVTLCEKSAPSVPPAQPKPGLKGPGCKRGSSFIGLNGVTSGEGVASVQAAFSAIYAADVKFDRRGFTYNGKMDERGTFGAATEEAVLGFQETKGGKYAEKIQSQLGSSLGNPDGCVGPKTGCALLIASGRAVAGYDMAKCKAKFGAKKIAQKKLAAAEPEESTTKVAESKNWLDRTREDASSSLFERLVKDVSNKKVI